MKNPATFLVSFLFAIFTLSAPAATDPLPSWNDGEVKRSIFHFVNDVTAKTSPHFVKPEDRIATFDNDGTLWSEVPNVEVEFTKMRLKDVLDRNASLKKQEPYKTLLSRGKAPVPFLTQKQILDIMARTHSGITEDEFREQVKDFFANTKHPKFQVPYAQTTYKPMLELISYLKNNGFQVFICSGGDTSFTRVAATDIYGIASENVIGSYFVDKTIEQDGKLIIMRTSALAMLNDGPNKPIGIMRQIGKRPIFAVGNERTGGDIAHLRFSSEGRGSSLQIMINHDDPIREFSYSEKDRTSLFAAAKYHWQIVSIKNDWKQVFSTSPSLARVHSITAPEEVRQIHGWN
jgi:hypothetical protein